MAGCKPPVYRNDHCIVQRCIIISSKKINKSIGLISLQKKGLHLKWWLLFSIAMMRYEAIVMLRNEASLSATLKMLRSSAL